MTYVSLQAKGRFRFMTVFTSIKINVSSQVYLTFNMGNIKLFYFRSWLIWGGGILLRQIPSFIAKGMQMGYLDS